MVTIKTHFSSSKKLSQNIQNTLSVSSIPYDQHPLQRLPRKLTNKEVVKLFYTGASPNTKAWTCECGAARTQNGSGFSNIPKKPTTSHALELAAAKKSQPVGFQPTLTTLPYYHKVFKIYGWMCYVLRCLGPCNSVQTLDVCEDVCYQSISTNTSFYICRTISVHFCMHEKVHGDDSDKHFKYAFWKDCPRVSWTDTR